VACRRDLFAVRLLREILSIELHFLPTSQPKIMASPNYGF
jgi:hypothetical protein